MGWALWRNRRTSYLSGHILILWWLVVGILGTAAYQHTVFDHYIAYLFPISALMGGVALGQLYHWQIGQFKIGKIGVGLLILGFASYNLPKMPLKTTGWTVSEIRQTSQTILDRVAPGEKYNLVLLSESHDLDGQNYRYFLTTDKNKPPVPLEERGNINTLFIINEEKKSQKVTDLPIYEIVTFPNKVPSEVYHIPNGPEITILRRDKTD